ncbi:TolC family protein [soil metagenome]
MFPTSTKTLRPILLAVVVTLLAWSPLAAQEVWDLEKSINYAISHNLQIKLQEVAEQLTSYQLNQSKAVLLPTLNGTSSYAINFGRSADPTTNQFVTQRIQTSSFSLSSSLILFSGLRQLNAIEQNKYTYLASQFQTEEIKNNVMLNVTAGFLQVLMARESIKSQQEQIGISLEQFNRTSQLVNAGVVPEGNLLNIKAQLANDSLNLINAQNNYDLAVLTIKLMLQLDPSADVIFSQGDININQLSLDLIHGPEAIYNTATGNQPQIKRMEYSVMAFEKGVKVNQGLRSPTLSLSGNVRTNYSSYELPPFVIKEPYFTQLNTNLSQTVGVTLSIPILNGLSTHYSIKSSRLQLERAMYQQQQVKDQLKQDVYKAYTDAAAAAKRYDAAGKNVQAIETAFGYTQSMFNLGAVNSLDYSTSRANLAQAQITFINAKYDYIFKVKVLDFYQGKPIKLQ